ncbi:hypothetical protein Pd630_LPD03703 [Rhodococcus opacus PD630]|nr:hypothetical protein Pd630_LPD03703 [Rhodococcus opacus PD630]
MESFQRAEAGDVDQFDPTESLDLAKHAAAKLVGRSCVDRHSRAIPGDVMHWRSR